MAFRGHPTASSRGSRPKDQLQTIARLVQGFFLSANFILIDFATKKDPSRCNQFGERKRAGRNPNTPPYNWAGTTREAKGSYILYFHHLVEKSENNSSMLVQNVENVSLQRKIRTNRYNPQQLDNWTIGILDLPDSPRHLAPLTESMT